MSGDFDDDWDHAEEERRPRDRMIDTAKAVLMERYFLEDGGNVYYGRQLEVALEGEFFHWITKKALNELAEERVIKRTVEKFGDISAHFYSQRRHRYPRRQIGATLRLIAEFSAPAFTRAVGHHGENLFESALAHTGFRIIQKKVREVDGCRWAETGHDLDHLIERDNIRYGVEVKNQLGYIDQTEFEIKLRMCRAFGVRPMFVARMMPKSYIHDVYLAGGFSLILKTQFYPLLADDLAKRVREKLGLPVGSVSAWPMTEILRFEKWHERKVRKGM